MPLLKQDAQRLSNNLLVQGVVEEIIKRDAIYALLPWVQVNHKAYVYNREATIPTINFTDVNTDITEGGSTFQDVTVTLKIMAQNVDIDKFLSETMGDTNSQIALQLQGAAKAVDQKFRNTLVVGDSSVNPLEFDGMRKLVTVAQTLTAGPNGAALTFDMLDQLVDSVPNRPDAIFMRYGTYRALKALMRLSGGMMPEQLKLRDFDGTVPHWDGIPILLSEYLPGNETMGTSTGNTCSIYAARMNTVDGLHGLYGGDAAGIRVEQIGTLELRDSVRYRLKWYTAVALKSTKSLARLQGVTNV
jgi:hypothetical protein